MLYDPSLFAPRLWRWVLTTGLLTTLLLSTTAAALPATAQAAVQAPGVSANGVYAFDLATGIELFASNEHERMQVGSMVKIVTALVTVEYADLDQQVTIVEADLVDTTVFSNMQLQAGDTLTVSQLLYGLLIPSGGDGAQALARHVGGIITDSDDPIAQLDAFVNEMNRFVSEVGLENSRFTNPDGADAPNSFSSAYDMAILSGMLMNIEFLANVVSEPGYSFVSVGPESRQYQEDTTNQLLGQSGVVGIKTGSTGEAGGCVVLARQVNNGNSTVITSVVGADLTYVDNMIDVDQRWGGALQLYAFMDANFTWGTLNDGSTFSTLPTELAVWNVALADNVTIPVSTNGDIQTRYQIALDPDGGGRIDLYFNDELVGSVPLQPATAIYPAPFGSNVKELAA